MHFIINTIIIKSSKFITSDSTIAFVIIICKVVNYLFLNINDIFFLIAALLAFVTGAAFDIITGTFNPFARVKIKLGSLDDEENMGICANPFCDKYSHIS